MARDRDVMTAVMTLSTNVTTLSTTVAELSAAMAQGFVNLNQRVDTLIDSIADLRSDLHRHIEEGHD